LFHYSGNPYEATRTDGAGPWQQFWRITLPLLRPALTMAFISYAVWTPSASLPLALVGRHLPVLSTFAYVEYLEYGNPYASAASNMLLLVMILITVGAYLRLAGPGEVVR
jgi:ABC-type sugar transport system permease subunit